jgi:hypothetical protein
MSFFNEIGLGNDEGESSLGKSSKGQVYEH